MGKAGKWLKLFLTGKKEKEKYGSNSSPLPAETRSGPISMPGPKVKRRWSFRRLATATGMDQKSTLIHRLSDSEIDQKRHAVSVAVAPPMATVAAAQSAAAVIRLTATATGTVEAAAAIKIQAVFRSYLARKALCALKGLVKLQALVRGHLVRRQATATLRCMQTPVTAQARARAQRIRMLDEAQSISHQRLNIQRRSPHEPRSRQSYEMEENVKIVEMDLGETRGSSKSRNSYSLVQAERRDHKLSTYSGIRAPFKGDLHREVSPARSTLIDRSPRDCSGNFGEFCFATTESSPPYLSASSIPDSTKSSLTVSQDYSLFPNYMGNTESSRAKARSQSAPKQRLDSCERPPSRRRPSVEGRSIARGVRMQRSSSHVSLATSDGYRQPWSIKLDRSSVSLQENECGSTSTVLTNTNYCRSLMAYEVRSELSLDINS